MARRIYVYINIYYAIIRLCYIITKKGCINEK